MVERSGSLSRGYGTRVARGEGAQLLHRVRGDAQHLVARPRAARPGCRGSRRPGWCIRGSWPPGRSRRRRRAAPSPPGGEQVGQRDGAAVGGGEDEVGGPVAGRQLRHCRSFALRRGRGEVTIGAGRPDRPPRATAPAPRPTRSPLCTCPTDSWTSPPPSPPGWPPRPSSGCPCAAPASSWRSPRPPRRWPAWSPRSCSRCRCSTSPSGSAPPGTSWAGRWPRCSSGPGPRSSAWRSWSPSRRCCSPTAACPRWAPTCSSSAMVTVVVGYAVAKAVMAVLPKRAASAVPAAAVGALVSVPATALVFVGLYAVGGAAELDLAQLTTFMVVTWHVAIGVGRGDHHRADRRARWWPPAPTWSAWPGATGPRSCSPTPTAAAARSRRRPSATACAGSAPAGSPPLSRSAWSWPGSCPAGPAPTRTAWSPWPAGSASSAPRRTPRWPAARSATTRSAGIDNPYLATGLAGVVGVVVVLGIALLVARLVRPSSAPPAPADERTSEKV